MVSSRSCSKHWRIFVVILYLSLKKKKKSVKWKGREETKLKTVKNCWIGVCLLCRGTHFLKKKKKKDLWILPEKKGNIYLAWGDRKGRSFQHVCVSLGGGGGGGLGGSAGVCAQRRRRRMDEEHELISLCGSTSVFGRKVSRCDWVVWERTAELHLFFCIHTEVTAGSQRASGWFQNRKWRLEEEGF